MSLGISCHYLMFTYLCTTYNWAVWFQVFNLKLLSTIIHLPAYGVVFTPKFQFYMCYAILIFNAPFHCDMRYPILIFDVQCSILFCHSICHFNIGHSLFYVILICNIHCNIPLWHVVCYFDSPHAMIHSILPCSIMNILF